MAKHRISKKDRERMEIVKAHLGFSCTTDEEPAFQWDIEFDESRYWEFFRHARGCGFTPKEAALAAGEKELARYREGLLDELRRKFRGIESKLTVLLEIK